MANHTVEVTWCHPETDVDYVVECEISGRYWGGSYYDPPEYPDVEVVDIWLDGKNQPALSKDETDTLIHYINSNPKEYDSVTVRALED